MGNEIQQTIKFKEVADVKEVLKGIDDIQKALGKLAIDPGTQASFNKLFDNIERQTEKANKAMSSGFKNKSDVKNYSDAMRQIISSYEGLIKNIEILKAKGTPLKDEGEIFKQLGTQIDELEKKYNKLQNTAAKAAEGFAATQQKIFNGMKAATSAPDFQEKQWKKLRDNFSEANVDIDKAKEALISLRKAYDSANTDGKNADKWALYLEMLTAAEKHVKEYEQALEKKNNAESNAQTVYKDLTDAQALYNEVVGKGAVELNKAGDAAKTDAQNFRAYAKEADASAEQTQHLNSELEHFKGKAAYFFGLSNAINLFKRAVRSAYDTVKDLDAVMTETAVVTDFDVGDMWEQLPEYTQRANELGVSIHSAYEAATIFYQQGLKTNEVMAVSNETLKMARIAGLDAATASDRMTNALRGFNMEMDKTSAQRVNDVYSKLAAITASDTDEISTAMTKVASLAHNANMEFETTAAFLAQIIESTRESAETAGTALKTVVARFSEVKKLYSKGDLLGQDEEGEEIDVNKVSTALRSAGINLNEYLTGAKGLDDIFMELAEKWDSLDIVQQRYIATMAAGSRQQSRFIALMSDYKRTAELVEAANNANGASNEQYGKTLDSLETKLARLKNAWNEFVLGLANSDAIKGAVDLLTSLITAINKLISSISGKNSGAKMITTFFTAFTAFKVGKAVVGKNNTMSTFFGKLVGDSEIIGKKGAAQIADSFYTNLASRIASFEKSGGLQGKIKQSLSTGLFNINDYFAPINEDMKGKIWSQLDTDILQKNGMGEQLWDTLDKGNLTVGELNKAFKDAGQTFQITKDNAAEFGIQMESDYTVIGETTNQMKACSAAAVAVGSAFMMAGNWLEDNAEGGWKTFGTIIKSLGTGLVVFGTIMSVYIPLQAKLMAQGVSSAIYSIPVIGWITAVISALVALGMAIYNINKDNSLETKLENATNDAKDAAQAAEDAKEAYEKLGEAWDALSDKYEAIENATKNTQEWRDAIREVNDAVLELSNTYDNVEISRDSNGILHVTNQDEIDNQVARQASNAAAAASVTKIRQGNIEGQVSLKNLQDTYAHHEVLDELINSGQMEAFAAMTVEEIQEATNKLIAKYYGEQEEGLSEYDALRFQQYGKSLTTSSAQAGSQKTVLGSSILQRAGVDKIFQDYANTFLSDKYLDTVLEESKEKVNELGTGDIKNKYAQERGYTNYEDFKDKNPEDETSFEEMRDYLVGAQVLDDASAQLTAFTNNLKNLNDTEKAFFEEQEGAALTQAQIEELRGTNIKDLYDRLGGEDVLGSFKDFEKQFNNTLEVAANGFDTSNFSNAFVSKLDEDLTKNLSSGAFKSFTNNLWSVYTSSGKEGMAAVQNSIKKLTANMDPKDVDGFIKAINSVDWASADSIRTLDDLAEEYGISSAAIEEFENQIIELNNAIHNIDLEKITDVLGIIKKIGSGEQGRSFSEEDYKNLIAYGVDPKDFQYNIETRNYDYTGQNLQDIEATVDNYLKSATSQLEKDIATGAAVSETKGIYGEPNVGSRDELQKFLGRYMAIAGDNSLIDQNVLFGSLDQMQKAYDMIMQAANRAPDSEQQLNQIDQMNYQRNTAAENVALIQSSNDENARQALIDQIVNSGLPEELISAFIGAVQNAPINASAENGYLSNNGQVAANVMTTLDKANEFGISVEDLNQYVEALRQIDDLYGAQEDTLYELALANARYQQGFKNIIDSYDEWVQLRQEDGSIRPDDGNLEQLKAYSQLKKDLKEMLNLSEDVSDEFMQMPEVAELLGRAVDGDTSAVAELRAELAKVKLGDKLTDDVEYFIDQLTQESINLEFGASFDDSEFAQGLMDAMILAGYTADEINEAFSNIGFTPPITGYQEIPYEDLAQNVQKANVKVVDPVTGAITEVTTDNVTDFKDAGVIKVPIFGDSKFTPPSMPSTKPSSSSGGGGGGGSSTKKPSYWENPYDELYNLQEKINEALRTREALERRYQKLLKEEKATLADIRKAYYSQITNLRAEAELQKQFAAGRLRQINEVGNKLYTDSEGNRSSFNSLGVTRYASYDANTGLIQIDWNGLEAIANDASREEEGKAAEAYISKLEELVSSYEEVRDKLWEIEDKIEELREAAIESYLSFEDRVLEALVNSYQQQIDSYQAISDSLEKASNEVLTSLREQVELSRQIRDNTDKEKQIADMENRLAYLQRDTSGANALEIQKLQKDLEDARESYTDNLVDQAIEKMQNEADLAAEQRARQIETMQEQLEIMKDTGALWQQVYDLMDEAAAGDGALSPKSKMVELLKSTEAFVSLSNIGQAKWWSEVAEEFHAAWVGRDEAEDKYKTDANNDGVIANSGTSAAINSVSATAASVSPAPTPTSSGPSHDEATEAGVAMNICGPNNGWGNGDTRRARLEEKGFDYGTVQSIVNDIIRRGWDDSYYRRKYGISSLSDYSYYAFKTGGLADFTGPAWLDGTKAKPEIILNAQDSANFIALKDILASLLNVQSGGLNGTKSGDNYFDIDISANIGSDYDVDRLAERLKQNIYNDGQYRNVNTINFLR